MTYSSSCHHSPLPSSLASIKQANPGSPGKMAIKTEREITIVIDCYYASSAAHTRKTHIQYKTARHNIKQSMWRTVLDNVYRKKHITAKPPYESKWRREKFSKFSVVTFQAKVGFQLPPTFLSFIPECFPFSAPTGSESGL